LNPIGECVKSNW